jgi:hypothetical protein
MCICFAMKHVGRTHHTLLSSSSRAPHYGSTVQVVASLALVAANRLPSGSMFSAIMHAATVADPKPVPLAISTALAS